MTYSGLVSGDMGDHETRIDLQQFLVSDAELCVSSTLGILHPDIGALDQFDQDFAPARLCKIQRDAKHITAVLHPIRRYLEAIFGVERDAAVAPRKIAKARALNLDYLRAHFGAQRGGIGLRNQNSGGNNFET